MMPGGFRTPSCSEINAGLIPRISAHIAIATPIFFVERRAGFPASAPLSFSCRWQAACGTAARCSLAADHRFRRCRAADSESLETGRPQGHRDHRVRSPDRRSIGTYFLSRLEPVTTRWIISFVFALLLLLLSGWRYRGKDHTALSVGIGGLSVFAAACANRRPTDCRLLAGPSHRSRIARANILLFFGASDFFSVVSYA